jgi:hypothetical protein
MRYIAGKVKVKARKPPHGTGAGHTLTYKAHRAAHQAAQATTSQPDPLDQPITPGSSITRRQAQRMAKNATGVRYGQQETGIGQQIAQAQQLGHDQSGWYQAYLDALKGYQTDTANRATETNTAVKALSDSFRGLDQGNLTAQQQQMNADAANRGATVDPRLSQDASNASLVRQALQGSLGALIAQHGLTASNQASDLANVIGPTQRLQAQAQNMRQQGALQEQKTSLKGQEGNFAQQFLDSLRQDEAKNILAASIASGKDLTAQQRITETTRHNKASEHNTAASRKAAAKAKGQTVNQYGYTAKEWAAFTPEQRQQKMAQVKKEQRAPHQPKNAPNPTSGPGSLTPVKEAAIVSQIQQVVSIIKSSKRPDHELRMYFANGQNPLKKVVDPRIINIAFDVARKGGLSAPNVKAAHDLGIHVGGHFKRLAKQPKAQVQQGIFTTGPFGGTGLG